MNEILNTLLRLLIGFSVLLFVTRLLGKKQLGQLTIFTYITGIALGNMAGDMIIHKDVPIIDGLIGLIGWMVLTFIVELISLKSSKARILLDGEPTIVIKKGKIMQDKLASQRLNIDDLTMMLRTNDVYSIKDVDYAILEPNGLLSILKKPELEQVTKKDMDVMPEGRINIPMELIVDGKVVTKNLKEAGLNEMWLTQQLQMQGITTYKEAFYAELQMDGSLFVERKSR